MVKPVHIIVNALAAQRLSAVLGFQIYSLVWRGWQLEYAIVSSSSSSNSSSSSGDWAIVADHSMKYLR
jgi:hypothetical protein